MKMDKIDSKLLSQQYFSVKSSINSLLIIFAYSIASKISLPSNQNVSNKYFQSSTINHYSFAIKNTTKIIKPNSQNQLFPIIRRSTISPSEILFPSNHIRLEIFPSIETQQSYRCAQSPFSFPRRYKCTRYLDSRTCVHTLTIPGADTQEADYSSCRLCRTFSDLLCLVIEPLGEYPAYPRYSPPTTLLHSRIYSFHYNYTKPAYVVPTCIQTDCAIERDTTTGTWFIKSRGHRRSSFENDKEERIYRIFLSAVDILLILLWRVSQSWDCFNYSIFNSRTVQFYKIMIRVEKIKWIDLS